MSPFLRIGATKGLYRADRNGALFASALVLIGYASRAWADPPADAGSEAKWLEPERTRLLQDTGSLPFFHRPRLRRLLLIVATLVLGSGIATAGEAPTAGASVSISGMTFHPEATAVKAGERVTWINEDAIAHNVTFKDGRASATSLSQGQNYTRVFDRPGTYEYFCGLHSYMTGRVIVTEK